MTFKKGEVSNPNGAPKRSHNAALMARKHATEAIEKLVTLMRSDKEEMQYKGAVALLDRGFGKPTEFVELTGEDGGAIKTTSIPAIDSWIGGVFRTAEEIVSKKPVPH